MTPPRGTCEFCKRDVLHYQHAAYPVTGWEVTRFQGGANQITGKRRLPNRIVHVRCLESHLRKPDHEQMELT